MTKDNEIPGLENARVWYALIVEMVEALEKAEAHARQDSVEADEARDRITESALSVEVRSNWVIPGAFTSGNNKPSEYRVLLTTGGPALQIVGTLNEYSEPVTAELQSQDWFKLWTTVPLREVIAGGRGFAPSEYEKAEQTLLTFARCFYFGE